MIYKLNINHDPQLRGTNKSQLIPDQEKSGMKELYDFLIYNTNHYFNIGSKIPFKFSLECELRKQAKLTDILRLSHFHTSYGLVVSEKLRKYLVSFNIIPCEWYDIRIRDHNNNYIPENYYWMYPYRLVDEIDFERTSKKSSNIFSYKDEKDFVEMRRKSKSLLADIEKQYPFNNTEKAMKLKTIHESIAPKQVFLKSKNIENVFDFFGFKYDVNWYVSERLKNALESSGFTGFAAEELTANDVIEFE